VSRRTPALLGLGTVLAAATACSSAGGAGGAGGSAAGRLSIAAGDTACAVSTGSLPAGRHTFAVQNTGSDVTEVYVYAAGERVVGEAENIGPGTGRDLTVDLPAGSYQVTCKPGMTGSGIRSPLTVTDSVATAAPAVVPAGPPGPMGAAAVAAYRSYVGTEARALVDTTAPFVAAVKAGDAANARALYPASRVHYERIEPLAESFGDLDPLIDERADDVRAGQQFRGFHALEKALFADKDISSSGPAADALLANCRLLQDRLAAITITPLTMANGAKSLLDEVAASKVTGEEERYSRIDLTDFAANVEGARTVYVDLRPLVEAHDPALARTVDQRFSALEALLAQQRVAAGGRGSVPGTAYVSYDALASARVKSLATAVDAVGESLGRVGATVTGSS
jgi:iron uptake system component EfeO